MRTEHKVISDAASIRQGIGSLSDVATRSDFLIDSHCHLHDSEFFSPEQAEEILKRAKQRGVEQIICIGTDPEDSLAARDFAAAHPGVFWTYGVHPENAGKCPEPSRAARDVLGGGTGESILPEAASGRPVAIGEVGLDYHTEGYDRAAEIRLFEEMLQLACDFNLPLSFHVREAFSDFFPVVQNFPGVRGVVHSFTDSKKVLRRILEETDFLIGVNGLATYSTLPTPPVEQILLETDAPFLTPVPFRGIINEPGYIPEIAAWLAGKLGQDLELIKRTTSQNARELFHLPDTRLRTA